MPTEPTDHAKQQLRARILTARRRRPGPVREAAARSLREHLQRRLATIGEGDVAAFLPLATEPPLLPALEHADALGHRVWVPVVEDGRGMSWCRWRPGATLTRGSLPGLSEPAGPRHGLEIFRAVRLLVVPAVALGRDGVRLGFGGGYYDRFLAELQQHTSLPETLACVFHDEILPAGTVPRDAHDALMTTALTESGIVELGGTGQE